MRTDRALSFLRINQNKYVHLSRCTKYYQYMYVHPTCVRSRSGRQQSGVTNKGNRGGSRMLEMRVLVRGRFTSNL